MSIYSIKYNIDAKPLGIGGAAKVYGCTRIVGQKNYDRNDNRFKIISIYGTKNNRWCHKLT